MTKRSRMKKTWPLHWSNACCSHPRKGETVEKAAARRIKEELGVSAPLTFLFKFEYSAQYNKEWGEHELDHVFAGRYAGTIRPNHDEVDDIKFVSTEKLREDIEKNPEKYTPWFKLALERVIERTEK